jgi:SAM-dependent methyltransferase
VTEGAAQHRKSVGPPERFDLIAGLQFSLLFALGLREQHRLLDIGCGSLRSGRLFIPYLAPGHYYGIEPDESLVQAGIEQEVGAETCARKQPHFLYRDDFAFSEFGARFDYLVAQSILSHTYEDLARTLLRNAREVVADDGIFCGTFFLRRPVTGTHVHRPRGSSSTGWVGMGGVGYRWREFHDLCTDAGFAVKRLRYPHPRQTWFVAVPEAQRARLGDLVRRSEGWRQMARELRRAEPLQTRNRRAYLAQRRLAVLRDRLRR